MNAREPDRPGDQHETMLDWVDTVLSAFTDSAHFDALTGHQQQEASFVVKSIAELLSGYDP